MIKLFWISLSLLLLFSGCSTKPECASGIVVFDKKTENDKVWKLLENEHTYSIVEGSINFSKYAKSTIADKLSKHDVVKLIEKSLDDSYRYNSDSKFNINFSI
jgi:hypothetical protein